MMEKQCPRCQRTNPPVARFCGRCGISLESGIDGSSTAGRIRHPQLLAVPDGFEPIQNAADLYFRTESAWGGRRLLGTESIGVVVLNAGYPLCEVALKVRGVDANGKELFGVEQTADDLPPGETVSVEIASYEIPSSPERLDVTLVSAQFSPTE